MKKILLFIVMFTVLGGIFYYFTKPSQKYSEDIQALQNKIGNSQIIFTDPVNQRNINLTFKDHKATDNFENQSIQYQISDILNPVNIDTNSELEYPFLIQANYNSDQNITLLAVARNNNDIFKIKDITKVGPTNQIDELHPYEKELVIDAYIGTNNDKQAVKLSYTFENDKIVPNDNNISLSTLPNQPTPTSTPENNNNTTNNDQQANDNSSEKIALTFDDGPGTFTPNILEVLKNKNVTATFFIIGENVSKHPDYVKQVKDAGHFIGNHTFTHPDLTKLSYDGQKQEITETNQAIIDTVGDTNIKYLRPPYGNHNDDTSKVLADLNMEIMLWNVDTRDWSGISADEIYNAAIAGAKNNAIILMHDGVNNSVETAKALPRIIDKLREQGYSLVGLPELN